jgi:hypothetical protein
VIGLGDASAGLCGGMVATVRDLFAAGIAPPPDTEPPPNGSPRFRAIVRRQVDSLDRLRVPLRYYDLQALRPDPPAGLAARLGREPARVVAAVREWPRVRSAIDAGGLPTVGLVRVAGWSPLALVANHQVLAHAYDLEPGRIRIRVYDPNHPGRDDVELRMDLEPGFDPLRERIRLSQSTGEPLRGFFRQPDPPPSRVLAAWRPDPPAAPTIRA